MEAVAARPVPLYTEPGRKAALRFSIDFADKLTKLIERHAGMTTAEAHAHLAGNHSGDERADTGPRLVSTMSTTEDRKGILARVLAEISRHRSALEYDHDRVVEPEVPIEDEIAHKQFLTTYKTELAIQTNSRLDAVEQFCSRAEWNQVRRWVSDALKLPMAIWEDEQSRRIRR